MQATRVVTRGGDGGETSLGHGVRVSKDNTRVEAYGAVDEVSVLLGAYGGASRRAARGGTGAAG
jgi:cob(I)alamin adenosyltransferase